jgi:ribosomal protein S18 acetylase RimI-like enzyme
LNTYASASLTLHLITQDDIGFLQKVYFSTREEELLQVPDWTEEMKSAFLNQQFSAQHDYYLKNYLTGQFFIIHFDSQKVGRWYIDENFDGGIRIIDIAILPQYRFNGVGTQLLKQAQKRAIELNKSLTIHVESFNPAMEWYKRLGFKKISETNGVYHLLGWEN